MSSNQNETFDDVDEDEISWSDGLDDSLSDLFGFEDGDDSDRSGLRALINSSLVSHRKLPMLDVVFDRVARAMSKSLRQMTDDNVEVTLDDVTSARFGDYLASIPQPSVIGVAYSPFFDNYCLIAADETLVSSIVDLLLGGRKGAGALEIGGRGFTAIELSLAERMLSLLVEDLGKSFNPIADPKFRLDRIETTPRFAAIAQEASVCALAKLKIRVDELGGRVSIIIPHTTLEPLREHLLQGFATETQGADSAWNENLKAGVANSHIDIQAILAKKEMRLCDVREMRMGETLVFNSNASSFIDVKAGDILIGRGKIGKSGNKIAIKLTESDHSKYEDEDASQERVS